MMTPARGMQSAPTAATKTKSPAVSQGTHRRPRARRQNLRCHRPEGKEHRNQKRQTQKLLTAKSSKATSSSRCASDETWYIVRNTPGVTGFIGNGTQPTPVSEKEIQKSRNAWASKIQNTTLATKSAKSSPSSMDHSKASKAPSLKSILKRERSKLWFPCLVLKKLPSNSTLSRSKTLGLPASRALKRAPQEALFGSQPLSNRNNRSLPVNTVRERRPESYTVPVHPDITLRGWRMRREMTFHPVKLFNRLRIGIRRPLP